MTLITHGLSGELRPDGIACNTLWPRSTIQSAAIANVWGKENLEVARTPGIMADAAHVIFTSKSSLTTDNCFIDDEVLLSTGMTLGDLDKKYLPAGLPNYKLAPDFFV
jgi:citronellol/citronellal dehydrogenase